MKYLFFIFLVMVLGSCSKDVINDIPDTYTGTSSIENRSKVSPIPSAPPIITFETITTTLDVLQVNDSVKLSYEDRDYTIYYPTSSFGSEALNYFYDRNPLVQLSFKLYGQNEVLLQEIRHSETWDGSQYSTQISTFEGNK